MLPFIVVGAEIATLSVFSVYVAVLTSMDREAARVTDTPRPDPVGEALGRAARFAFYLGIGAVIVLSLAGGLGQWPTI